MVSIHKPLFVSIILTWAHFDGRMGGLIAICSKRDGKLKSQIALESPPVFDGLASAANKLVVSCRSGSVLCFE